VEVGVWEGAEGGEEEDQEAEAEAEAGCGNKKPLPVFTGRGLEELTTN
jgi:hypothetical protein